MAALTVIGGGSAALAAPSGEDRGKPGVERDVTTATFFDEFIFDVCGVRTNTTLTERITTKTFPDGSQTVHVVANFVPDDPSIASERDAFTDRIAPDGTRTTITSRRARPSTGSCGTAISRLWS